MQLTETGVAIEILTWMWQVLYTEHEGTLTNVPTTPTDTTSGLTESDKRTRKNLTFACALQIWGDDQWLALCHRVAETDNPESTHCLEDNETG